MANKWRLSGERVAIRWRTGGERGAMVIMVAITLFVLTALSAYVLDYGIVWTARGQAQNAADAGALSAGWWLVDHSTDFSGATVAAQKLANANAVWTQNPQTPDIVVTVPLTCPPGANGGTCARVDVHRGDGSHTNTLPVFFASLLGINSQSIQATATAQLTGANATNCMRPWFMIDKYVDTNGDGVFDAGDTYTSPGYQVPADIGTIVQFHYNASPSGFGQVDVGSGGNAIQDAIDHCVTNGAQYYIGETVPTKPGATDGPERHGMDDLLAWDPFATYDLASQSVINSCASTGCTCGLGPCPNGAYMSPRLVVVALCSPLQADCAAGGASNGNITITNFLSFFLLGYSGGGPNLVINAELIGGAGAFNSGGGTSPSAFLQVVRLVR